MQKEICVRELEVVSRLPVRRRKIYELVRFEGEDTTEIAAKLSLSVRTVENHLFISRKEVRNYMKQCI